MGYPINSMGTRPYTYGKGRQGRHSDVPGVGPEVASGPKYYQIENVVWKKLDFTVKFRGISTKFRTNSMKNSKKYHLNESSTSFNVNLVRMPPIFRQSESCVGPKMAL